MILDLSATLADAVLAVSPSPSPTPNIDPSRVTPGLLGFISLLFLVVTGFFLARSMIKQFKKIDFDEAATEEGIARPESNHDDDVAGGTPVAEDSANGR